MSSDISCIRCSTGSVEEDFEILSGVFQLFVQTYHITVLCDNLFHSHKMGVIGQTSEHFC